MTADCFWRTGWRHWPLPVLLAALVLASTSCQTAGTAGLGAAQAAPPFTSSPAATSAAAGQQPASQPAHLSSADQQSYNGIPAGLTDDGYPYLGSPDAPVTLEEYTDFLCPYCARHVAQTVPTLLDKYVSTGKVRYVFHDMPLESLHPTSPKAHAAARCVVEQGASLFWAMHDQLFREQEQWRGLADPADYLAGAARAAGADEAAYTQCVSSGRTQAQVQRSVAAGQSLGFNGTPSFRFIMKEGGKSYTLVGAQPADTFTQWLDALLAGKEPPKGDQAQAQPQELPLWANAKGLAPDPQRAGFDLAGDPYKGNPEAKVAVVEFSNFQCLSCRQHVMEVQPAIDRELVDTGQVMWVFKNLPLKSLPQSTLAAAAAECAGEQGRYWEMHDLLFQNQAKWAVDPPDPELTQLAGQLGLDGEKFGSCFNGRRGLELVVNDLFDAQGAATSAPTFVVLSGGKGSVMRGSKPADQFIAILKGMLDTAAKPGN